MSNYSDFADWLFPGDDPGPKANPLPEDACVADVLAEVAHRTQIPVEWIEKSARAVLDGLAGLQCLWYLHGASGEFLQDVETPGWAQLTGRYSLIDVWVHKYIEVPALERDSTLDRIVVENVDWAAGTITMTRHYQHPKHPKTTEQRLGKVLRRIAKAHSDPVGYFASLIKVFETRKPAAWEWKISTHPYDVLTMSHKRPWTSCMRPGGVAELGPLTDMAAGSAIMFFYRPNAPVACGRIVLRPVVDQFGPSILNGATVYGCGPDRLSNVEIYEVLESAGVVPQLRVNTTVICPLGEQGTALTRNIYSDTDRDYCKQADDEYDTAYRQLGAAGWPAPALDLGELPEIARELAQQVEARQAASLVDLAREIANAWVANWGDGTLSGIRALFDSVANGEIPSADDLSEIAHHLPEDYDFSTLNEMIEERFREIFEERLANQKTYVIVLSEPEGEDAAWELDQDIDMALDEIGVRKYVDVIPKEDIARYPDSIQKYAPDAIDIYSAWKLIVATSDYYPVDVVAAAAEEHGATIDEYEIPPGEYEWSELIP